MKILISSPISTKNRAPFDSLSQQTSGHQIIFNDLGRQYTHLEHLNILKTLKPNIIIADLETYDEQALLTSGVLKMIARLGIGIDSIDLDAANKHGIIITNTPDAPSNATAELVIALALNMLRHIQFHHETVLSRQWNRQVGREFNTCTFGIIGCGRIGGMVIDKCSALGASKIITYDPEVSKAARFSFVQQATIEQILKKADVITIHIPLTKSNKFLLGKKEFSLMKKNAILINTSRGGIIDENALYDWLKGAPEAQAASDVFLKEPYRGNLLELENVILTPHIGSCTFSSKRAMESGAVEEVIRFLREEPLHYEITDFIKVD